MERVELETALQNEEELDALKSNCFVKFVFDARGTGTVHMTIGDNIGISEIYHALLSSISGIYCAMKSDPDWEKAGNILKKEIRKQVNGEELWNTEDDLQSYMKMMS